MTTLIQFADYYVDLFENDVTLNVDVFFGDQTKIRGPLTVCIEPNQKRNTKTRSASARAVHRDYSIYILIYCNRLEDSHSNRHECDSLAETIEEIIYKHPTCGGKVIDVNVGSVESGYVTKSGTGIIAATRLTVTGQNEEFLPASVE